MIFNIIIRTRRNAYAYRAQVLSHPIEAKSFIFNKKKSARIFILSQIILPVLTSSQYPCDRGITSCE